MTEENKAPPPAPMPIPKRATRRKIVYATLLFCFGIITYIVVDGTAENTLHQSALSWAFSTCIFVISGYVFGAVADQWIGKFTGKDQQK